MKDEGFESDPTGGRDSYLGLKRNYGVLLAGVPFDRWKLGEMAATRF